MDSRSPKSLQWHVSRLSSTPSVHENRDSTVRMFARVGGRRVYLRLSDVQC